MQQQSENTIDRGMMERCIELSRTAVAVGELPFASIIARDDEIITSAINRVARDRDVTRHAELVAISAAQKALGKMRLRNCTIYSNVEPCPMCSFPIREARIGRVVFAIKSPIMGGFSRWNVLRDAELSNTMPEAFAEPPEVVADDFEAVADHRVEGFAGVHEFDREFHRFALHAASDRLLHR